MRSDKLELDRLVASDLGLPLREVQAVTAAFLAAATDHLARISQVYLPPLGAFTLKEHVHENAQPRVLRTFRDREHVVTVDRSFTVRFRKATGLRDRIRVHWLRRKEHEMEKLGVQENIDQERLEKLASAGCPLCGATPRREGGVLVCPQHGTEPFESSEKK